ncbi:hypothetical protein MAM1_0059d03734 [Mucor ambiguus]|uniref:Uncharacterized protein n=1 Tax=Mucor ambiguus TaxID=91626 RepID=A0A0C9MAE6_9FUNG|nr:hypothetical protein MAM1_0059d03734 [Mucor ambiguus]
MKNTFTKPRGNFIPNVEASPLEKMPSEQFPLIEPKSKWPEYFIKKLAEDAACKRISTKTLANLHFHLNTMPTRFIHIQGAVLVVDSLSRHRKDLTSSNQAEGHLLRCLKALLSNSAGIDEFTAHPEYVQEIVASLESTSIQCRKLVCEILILLCYYKTPQGQQVVMDALKRLSTSSSSPFYTWIVSWKQVIARKSVPNHKEEYEYSLFNLRLVNAILNTVACSMVRTKYITLMEEAGLGYILETGARDKELSKQIEAYYAHINSDQQEKPLPRIHRKALSTAHGKGTRIFKSLVDPHYVFELVLNSIEGSVCYDYFLNMLQNILVYNNISNDTERNHYFQCIDSYIDHQNKGLDLDRMSSFKHIDDAAMEEQSKKVESLEDLLRMSRHTISTLRQKLREMQAEYETNFSTMEHQLDLFYKVIEQDYEYSVNGDATIFTINKQNFAKSYTRMMAKESSSKAYLSLQQDEAYQRRHSRIDNIGANETSSLLKSNRVSLTSSFTSTKYLGTINDQEPSSAFDLTLQDTKAKSARKVGPEMELHDDGGYGAEHNHAEPSKRDISTASTLSSWPQQANSSLDSLIIPAASIVTGTKSTAFESVQSSTAQQDMGHKLKIVLPPPLPMETTNKTAALPPPPPPPPPATSMKPASASQDNLVTQTTKLSRCPSVKTRILQWQKLDKNSIQATIWSDESVMVEQYRKPAVLEEKLDRAGLFRKMEEAFGQHKEADKQWPHCSNKKKWRKRISDHEVHVLDPQKAANITIAVLMKLKKYSIEQMVHKIQQMDQAVFDEVILENLIANLPSDEEKKKLHDVLQDNAEKALAKPDLFLSQIIKIPRHKARVTTMLLKLTWDDRLAHLERSMASIMEASIALRHSASFKEFLNLVLLIGNFLNGSNFQGGAFGIRIASINKLIDTKSFANDTTLLHFIIDMMEAQFPDIYRSIISELSPCTVASRVTLQDLVYDYNQLRNSLDNLVYTLTEIEKDEDNVFIEKTSDFFKNAMVRFNQLQVRYTSMTVAYNDVLLYFGEDPSDIKPDEFFNIFVKFISDWECARKDLMMRRKEL